MEKILFKAIYIINRDALPMKWGKDYIVICLLTAPRGIIEDINDGANQVSC